MATIKDNKHKCSNHRRAALAKRRAEARAVLSAQPSASNGEPVGDWRPHIARLARRYGNDWPAAALERLLQLTARYGYSGAWSEDAQERAEQEERLALHRWAREVIEAGIAFQQTAYLEH
ncbi:MAG: hypothetical protein M0R06_03520 [Sphaerochaeta sp.]|jgi:hypothetical protein|nr:hypothetical protein [Sphaerochaeta sp.]